MAEHAPPPSTPNDAADGVDRGVWSSKLGFVLAASGSAIGLGNIVFFASNAYQFGGGAFYVPYFIALFVLGIPVMITEFSLGTMTGRSFPMALGAVVGKKGEFVGWWSLASALFITMYYVALLSWALCMMVGAVFGLMEPGATAPFTPVPGALRRAQRPGLLFRADRDVVADDRCGRHLGGHAVRLAQGDGDDREDRPRGGAP